MRPRILVLVAGVVFVAGVDRILAHHSFSATYDSTQKVELAGRREGIRLAESAFVPAD